jgi:hypothetical protein
MMGRMRDNPGNSAVLAVLPLLVEEAELFVALFLMALDLVLGKALALTLDQLSSTASVVHSPHQ